MVATTDNMVLPYCGTDNNQWFWLIILFLFVFGFGGNGFNRGNMNTDFQGYATRDAVNQGFQFNQLENGQRAIERGICDLRDATQSGFNGVDRALCCGFNGVERAIAENRFAQQDCCCTTNRNIDSVKAEAYKNTCDITTAIHAEGEATRALIQQNVMQDLRDKLADRDRELFAATAQISQDNQTRTLVNTLRPCSIPAYLTCSPYESAYFGGRGYGGWGNGCGCNNNCCGC